MHQHRRHSARRAPAPRLLAAALLLAASPALVPPAAAQVDTARSAPPVILGSWSITKGARAPWLEAKDTPPDTAAWLRRTVTFGAKRVSGTPLLTCDEATYEAVDFPAAALFQGGLPAPAERFARELGLVAFPVRSVELNCETGIYDFHFTDDDTMLVAVDNVIWTFVRRKRARGAAGVLIRQEGGGGKGMAWTGSERTP